MWTILPKWQVALWFALGTAVVVFFIFICTRKRLPAYLDIVAVCDALGARRRGVQFGY